MKITTATQQEFASIIGKGKSYITQLKKEGKLVFTAEGLVDVKKSLKFIEGSADPTRIEATKKRNAARVDAKVDAKVAAENASSQSITEKAEDEIGTSFAAAKALNEKYKALTSKLEYERASGKLVDAGAARLFAADLAATFRGSLEMLPDRIAPELVPLKDTETIRALLVEQFEHVLNDLADKIKKWGES